MDRRTFLQTTGLAALATTGGCGTLFGSGSPALNPPRGEWRQATGGPGNTATAPTLDVSGQVWTATLPDAPMTAPVVGDSTVVVGTAGGVVRAFDLESGTVRWRAETAGVQGTPAIVEDWVVVAADDGRLHRFALDDGTARTLGRVGSSMISGISAASGWVFTVAEPGWLVAVDVANWDVVWRELIATRAAGKPAVGNGQVVISGTRPDGSGLLRVLEADTGGTRWQVETATGLATTAVHTGDQIFVAGEHRNRIRSSPGAGVPDTAGVFWFDDTGHVERTETIDPPLWDHCRVRFLASDGDWSTLSGCDGLVAHGPGDGVWSTTSAHGITTRPLVTPDGVLYGDSQGQFWLVNPERVVRTFAVEGPPATPAVLDRGIVVPAGRRLLAFG